jgi:8-oxo-dGTP diphosphatase
MAMHIEVRTIRSINATHVVRETNSVDAQNTEETMKQRSTVVCQRDTRILMVSKDGSRWSLPGGKVANGESFQQAASRELQEETGLHALNMRYLFDFSGARTCHHVFVADIDDSQTPVPGNEIRRCRWVKVADVALYETSTCTRGIVEILSLSAFDKPQTTSRYQQTQAFVRNLRAAYTHSIFCG